MVIRSMSTTISTLAAGLALDQITPIVFLQAWREANLAHGNLALKLNAARTTPASTMCWRIPVLSGLAQSETTQTAISPWPCAPSIRKNVVTWAQSILLVMHQANLKSSAWTWPLEKLAPSKSKPSVVFQLLSLLLIAQASTSRQSSMMKMTLHHPTQALLL